MNDSTLPGFWTSRYESGKTPWDFHGVPLAVKTFLASASCAPCNILVPGCGSGYEVKAFQDAGLNVTAIDFAPVAVDRTQRLAGSTGATILLGDFFTHDFPLRHFDIVYERTFLCSLPPSRWQSYSERMAALLKTNGRLIGIFLYGNESEPPPYPLTTSIARELFVENFQLIRDEPVSDSLPIFQGMERWQEWRRI
jgi:Thiopurine S-methyltransferase (TPMT)